MTARPAALPPSRTPISWPSARRERTLETRRRRLARRGGGFLLLVLLSYLPFLLLPNLPLFATAAGVAGLAAHWVLHATGVGGLAGAGLRRHPGWGRNVALAAPLGGLFLALMYATAWRALNFEITGLVALDDLIWLVGAAVVIAGFSAAIEEMIFRGYLLRTLRPYLGDGPLVAVTALLFSAYHLPHLGAVPANYFLFWGVMGVAFALPALVTRSLWFSVGLHWGGNVVAILLLDGRPIVETIGFDPAPSVTRGWINVALALLLTLTAWAVARTLANRDTAGPPTARRANPTGRPE